MVNDLERLIEKPKLRLHIVGITGVGVVGLATIFHERGAHVTGSDSGEEFFTSTILQELHIPVTSFAEENITESLDMVMYTTAWENQAEVLRAKSMSIPTFSYVEVLAALFNQRKGIVITGSHGKTTTTAMVGEIFVESGQDPTVLVGSTVTNWNRTARNGRSDWMIIEGDEYQAKILALHPKVAVITNIDYDHPDFYPTEDAYIDMFRKFIKGLSKDALLVTSKDVLTQVGLMTNDISARVVLYDPKFDTPLQVIRGHNLLNASAAFTIATALGIPDDQIKKALLKFRGTKRRLEHYPSVSPDLLIFDDYAHHPTEIKATLQALKLAYPNYDIYTLFQPHTFSRTKMFLREFAGAFDDADEVGILEIYGSAREKNGEVNGKVLFESVKKENEHAEYFASIEEACETLLKRDFESKRIFIAMGAGDVWRVADAMAKNH